MMTVINVRTCSAVCTHVLYTPVMCRNTVCMYVRMYVSPLSSLYYQVRLAVHSQMGWLLVGCNIFPTPVQGSCLDAVRHLHSVPPFYCFHKCYYSWFTAFSLPSSVSLPFSHLPPTPSSSSPPSSPPLPLFLPPLQMMSPLAEEKEWFVSKDVLQKVLVPHPKLRAAIFPPPPKKGTPAETQDISVYHLLQVN